MYAEESTRQRGEGLQHRPSDAEKQQLLENDAPIPYEQVITLAGFGRFHYWLLLVCGWANASDAIEVLCVSFLLPFAECDLKLVSSEKGLITSFTFLGMMIGGLVWGVLSDSRGRKFTLQIALLVNSLFGFLSSFSQNFTSLLILRLLSGIGVGGSIPVVWSYFGEFLPKNRRGAMFSALASFWMMGNIVVAALAWLIIPQPIDWSIGSFQYNSWRLFVAVCSLPSLIAMLLLFKLPESPKFLLERGRMIECRSALQRISRINKTVANLESADSCINTSEPKERSRKPLSLLFKDGIAQIVALFLPAWRIRSIVLSVTTFCLFFGYYGLWMWMPELFKRMEMSGGAACSWEGNVSFTNSSSSCEEVYHETYLFVDSLLSAASSLPGNILTILLMDRCGRRAIMVASMVISGGAVFLIPVINSKISGVILSCFFGGVSVLSFNALDCLSTELFPTSLRSTALGFTCGIGRIGAILGNMAFGLMVDINCAIPIVTVSSLLVIGGIVTLKLPEPTGKDID